MSNQNKSELSTFAQKALQRIQDQKKPRYRTLKIPSLGEEIRIRNLWDDEIAECTNMEDPDNPLKGDRYGVYLAVVEPNLRDIAIELKNAGEINEYIDVVNIFQPSEIKDISIEAMKLSGWISEKPVQVVEGAAQATLTAIKN